MGRKKRKIELREYDFLSGMTVGTLMGEEQWLREYGKEDYEDKRLHYHTILEIGVCRSGEGVLVLGDRELEFGADMISVIPPYYPHSTFCVPGTKAFWEYIYVDVEQVLASICPDDLLTRQKRLEKVYRKAIFCRREEMESYYDLLTMIFREMQEKKEAYEESVAALAVALVISTMRLHSGKEELEENEKQADLLEQIRPGLNYIGEHYREQIKVSEIAEACSLSESYLRKLFVLCTGLTPGDYVNRIRIKQACALMKKNTCSMDEISALVGYTTVSTFNRNFIKMIGMSPCQWKKQRLSYKSKKKNTSE